jgi:hypothetical protein
MMNHSLVNEQSEKISATPQLLLPAGLGQGSPFAENWNVKLGDILRPLLANVWVP